MSIGFIGLHYWQNHVKNVCRRCQAWPLVQQIWHCYHCQHRRMGWFGCRCPRSLKRFNVKLYIVLMLPLIPILAGGIMKLTQDERERYEQRLQWKKEGSSYEIEFAYGLLDSSERPLGRVPARTGMAAPWHKHVAVLLAESCILMNIVMSCYVHYISSWQGSCCQQTFFSSFFGIFYNFMIMRWVSCTWMTRFMWTICRRKNFLWRLMSCQRHVMLSESLQKIAQTCAAFEGN